MSSPSERANNTFLLRAIFRLLYEGQISHLKNAGERLRLDGRKLTGLVIFFVNDSATFHLSGIGARQYTSTYLVV